MSIKPSLGLLLVLLLAMLPLFARLDSAPLHQWDEARLAKTALEMVQHGRPLVPHYCGDPDMWSTKPPLMIWCQACCIKLAGANELAVRLPSAIAGLCTCLMLFFFFRRRGQPLTGILCAAVLLTTHGYLGADHSARTGDYDALLTCFTTGYCLAFFVYLQQLHRRHVYVFFACLILAVLTKGVQGLLFVPGLLLYTFYKRRVTAVLQDPAFYIGTMCFLLLVPGYYLLREHYNAGYIQTVWMNELGGRYGTAVEGHTGTGWFYIEQLITYYFRGWCLLLLPAIFVTALGRRTVVREITVYAALLAGVYLLLISGAQTKLPWYLMPLCPLFAIIVGALLSGICTWAGAAPLLRGHAVLRAVPFLLPLALLAMPYTNTIKNVLTDDYGDGATPADRDLVLYLKDALHHPGRRNNAYCILNSPPRQDMLWYYDALAYAGRPVKTIYTRHLQQGMHVIPYGDEARQFLEDHFEAQEVWRSGTLHFFAVGRQK